MVNAADRALLPPDIRWMRRGLLALVVLALLALLGGLLWRAALSSRFDWRLLRVEGDVERNSVAQLRANTLPRLVGNFISTDLRTVRAAFEALPWVRHAEVRRVWPGQLLVRLEEHRAVAFWDGRGEYGEPALERALLNGHREVFHANLGDVEDEALPQLAGPSGSEAQVMLMWQRLAAIAETSQQQAERLELSGRGSWRLQLVGGAQIELGRGETEDLVRRLARVLPHALALARRFQTQIQSADLRHSGGYALRLVGIGTLAEAPKKTPRKP